MAILLIMATPRIKATYSLDVESVRDLERMAKRLKVSKSEALRRAIRLAAETEAPASEERLEALDKLQVSVAQSGIDLESWAEEVDELRKSGYRR